jgi:hypothetical protein
MKRIITLTAIALGLSGGVALADRFNGGRGGHSDIRDHRNDRPVVRDRGDNRWRGNDNRWRGDDNRWRGDNRSRVRVERVRPTFRNNRFYFSGGTYRTYNRPVINVRYRDYYRRPALVVENYDAVPGYIWTAGQWQWNGYEWTWIAGHYDVDQSYNDDYYDQGSYDQGSYDDSYDRTYVAPSASVSGSVQWGY